MSLTAEQLEIRKKGIGASEAAAVLGLNPWRTPLDIYWNKIGESEPDDQSEAARWGNILEPPVGQHFAEVTDKKIRRRSETLFSKDYPHMLCHLDFKIEGEPALLEVKTGGFFTAKEWGDTGSDEIPDWYLPQVIHQMIVSGYRQAYAAVLLGGQDFRWYEIPFDEELACFIIEKEAEFWQRVIDRTPPPPSTLSDLNSLYPLDNGEPVEATAEIVEAISLLKDCKATEVELKSQLSNRAHMADASTLIDPSGHVLATWKSQTARRLDTTRLKSERPEIAEEFSKESESRVFRLRSAR